MQTDGPGTAGDSYDKTVVSFTSDSTGLAQYTGFVQGAYYKFARGDEPFGDEAVLAPATATWALPEFLGQP
jgi:hypothetical protein